MSIIKDTSVITQPALNLRNALKRRRDDGTGIELDERPFSIRPDSSDPFTKPWVLAPVCLLARSRLPLSYLDTAGHGSRFFSAQVRALEFCHERDGAPHILIAEEGASNTLYAVERVRERTYALCRLGGWVKRQDLDLQLNRVILPDYPSTKRQVLAPARNGKLWWSGASVDTAKPLNDGRSDARPANRLSMLQMRPVQDNDEPRALTITPQAHQPRLHETENRTPLDQSETHSRENPDVPQLSSHDTLQELCRQYLEALYLSRTSLAYFTKGPLSRARAASSSQTDPDLRLGKLVTFLREAILTSTVMDKKFRQTIADIVKELPVRSLDTPRKPKSGKKRKWKSKRDKLGFFVDERDYVERWYYAEDQTRNRPCPAETNGDAIREKNARLRSRETYLQIILALEVLALEASIAAHADQRTISNQLMGATEPLNQEVQHQNSFSLEESKKSKSRKQQDLPALLETLVEKLGIWHSLEGNMPTEQGIQPGNDNESNDTDELRNFCIEVIIPFYMSRIPRYAATVNKKLGGPSAPTPLKHKQASFLKPGDPAIRQPPEKKPRQPLGRVSTDSSKSISTRPPVLHRAATDSDTLLRPIKREPSTAVLLDATLLTNSRYTAAGASRKRHNPMESMSFHRREVDLSALSTANEAKMRKKAQNDARLREALATIRKPNREMAVKEIAENTDLSFAKATAPKPRPAANGNRKKEPPQRSQVDVEATPKHFGRSIRATPAGRSVNVMTTGQRSLAGTLMVPSSSTRLNAPPPDLPASTFEVPRTAAQSRHTHSMLGVEETPSRGLSKFTTSDPVHPAPMFLESPVASRYARQLPRTPSKIVRSLSLAGKSIVTTPMNLSEGRLGGTPAKRQPNNSAPLVAASPNLDRRESATKGDDGIGLDVAHHGASVYDALGWNDDEYEGLS